MKEFQLIANKYIAELDTLAAERNALIVERNTLMAERDALIVERNAIFNSRSWRYTRFLSKIRGSLRFQHMWLNNQVIDSWNKLKNRTVASIIKFLHSTNGKKILWHLPKKFAHKILYYMNTGKKLDLVNPKDFNEKIQYLMLYKHGKIETKLTDKYLVRQYVSAMGYAKILPTIFAIYHDVSEIDIEKLPEKFVLKTNHGSGSVFVCREKSTFDLKQCKKELGKSLKNNFAKISLEYHYSNIKPMIICEEYIDDGSGNMPTDYKIYCFNGIPHCLLVCTERDKNLKLDYYNLQWNYLEYAKPEYRSEKKIAKPRKLDEMLRIAENLSKPFPFVRVD